MHEETQVTGFSRAHPGKRDFLQEPLRHLRALIENNPLAVILLDEQQRILMCNRAFERMFQYEESELLGREVGWLAGTGEQREEAERLTRQLLEGKSIRAKTARDRRDGSRGEVEIWGMPLAAEGRVQGAFALYQDVTERERAEAALRASEQRYRLLFERNLAGVYRTKLDGEILECNEAFARMFGFSSPEEARRHTAWELHFERNEREECMVHLHHHRTITNVELRLRRVDGTPIWVLQNTTLIDGENGEPELLEGTLIDITERKRAEDALRRLSRRLLRLQDEERRRIARELHDTIAQQLAAVGMYLSVIQQTEGGLGEQGRQALEESLALIEECSRGTRTFSYLLHPPLLDEVGLLSALRWYVDGFMKRSGIRVELEATGEGGRLSREVETTLFRIVQESLTNVHRHSESAVARIRMARRPEEIRLEIEDEGRGIGAGKMKWGVGGVETLGVGIAGMGERMKQLGGKLEIESTSRGTTVRVILPLPGSEGADHDADIARRRSRGGAARVANAAAGAARVGSVRRGRHRT
jgi:PAS domain S-box-containing protein